MSVHAGSRASADTVNVSFTVEHAGCTSCAARIRAALEPLGALDQLEIDEERDAANVTMRGNQLIAEGAVDAVLAEASTGSGHTYRIQPGSWRGQT